MKGIEISRPPNDPEPNDQDSTAADEGDVAATGVPIRGRRRRLPICRIRDSVPSPKLHPAKGGDRLK